MLDPVPLTIAATPSPTRSHVFFDDVDYQKIRQPPRSTPMVRKQFAARTPNPKRASNRKTSTYSRWTVEEDELLRQAVSIYGPHKWSLVAAHVPNRTPMQCSTRWLGALKQVFLNFSFHAKALSLYVRSNDHVLAQTYTKGAGQSTKMRC